MIRDLAYGEFKDAELTADVLVIGAGIAGLLVATRLARSGLRVIVAESGGLSQIEDTHPLNEVDQLGDIYLGAEHGRFRCLGGTSTRWGGAMLPFQKADLEPHSAGWNVAWPISLDTLTSYQAEIERLFNLTSGPYDFPEIMLDDHGGPAQFMGREAKWPSFRNRNVANVLADDIRSETGPIIWTNATATNFALDPAGRLSNVRLRSSNYNALLVTAQETVIAAGAIESTRLLLLADRQNGGRIFSPSDILGRYFHDHLSLPSARLTNVRKAALNRVVGFRFEGSTMRNLRFEPTATLRNEHRYPAGFLHIAFKTSKPTGFDTLRDVYRKFQKGSHPNLPDITALFATMPWLSRALWWRLVEKRLLYPHGADLEAHTVVEQEPRRENRITLSSRRVDQYGAPLAAIEWRVHENDAANALALTKAFVSAWNAGNLSNLATLELSLNGDVKSALTRGGGIYHPGGSVRMAADKNRGVVDSELRIFQVPNISVISTATFPSGGGSNPTMMLMMAALRAADRIVQEFR